MANKEIVQSETMQEAGNLNRIENPPQPERVSPEVVGNKTVFQKSDGGDLYHQTKRRF